MTLRVLGMTFTPWEMIGLFGQALFMGRWVVQWFVSERRKESVIPMIYWYMSLVGAAIVLAYGIAILNKVIILGQVFGVVVYLRNLAMIAKRGGSLSPFAVAGPKAGPPDAS